MAEFMGEESQTVHLDVHPSVVFKLGEDLISDSMQALAELIKNSYDADATWARVAISTGSHDEALPSHLTVTDNGIGMSPHDIERGWLTISNSVKREMKAAGRDTERGRTPLGDKGLGRLGAQRLGETITILTRPIDAQLEHELTIDWTAFRGKSSLHSVALELITRPTTRNPGTVLTITNLRDPDFWQEAARNETGEAAATLQKQLAVLLSPYGEKRGLKVFLQIDDRSLDLYDLPAQVRKAAEVRYTLDYAPPILTTTGNVSLSYWEPQERASSRDKGDYEALLKADNGASFLQWLLERRSAHMARLGCRAGQAPYFLQAVREFDLRNLDGVALTEAPGLEADSTSRIIADPGPFYGEVDYVTFGQGQPEPFTSRSEFKNFLKSLAGIRIYRDGFGIRMPEDWIGLRKGQTSGQSFYGLRPENTLGFIDISAKHNAQLVETTDREGFAQTPSYSNFLNLLELWRVFSSQLQTFIRRSYNEYRSEVGASKSGYDAGADTHVLLKHVEEHRAETVVRARRQIDNLKAETAATAASHQRVREELDGDQRSLFSDSLDPAVAQELTTLADADKRREEVATEMTDLIESLESEQAVIRLLQDQVERSREQLALIWEAVSLGLAAEAISHEVAHVADGLIHRTANIRRYLSGQQITDARLSTYLQHAQSSAAALKRQLAHINPSLRYMRERREAVQVGSFCADVADYFSNRWENGPLSIEVASVRDFVVWVNRGKLTQILDNLLLNSEYWLLQDHKVGTQHAPCVRVEVNRPFISVYDNGRGIDPSLEGTLFEPFISAKKRGEGRGLGLYVVTQLLESENSSIALSPDRNANGRLYKFRVNLEGMENAPR